jgi:hypothetical protein
MNPDFWKNPVAPTTLATIAVIVGGVVRLLKTKQFSEILDALPVSWVKAIPKTYLPWLAVVLGVVLTMLDAKLNGGLKTWGEALWVGLAGVLSGSMAIAGHETIAKTVERVRTGKTDPPPPPARGQADAMVSIPPAPPSGLSRYMLRTAYLLVVGFALMLFAGSTTGCAAVAAALPHVIAAIVDGGQIIDRIAEYLSKWFAMHPDPIVQPKVELAIAKARRALSAALHAADGADKLDQAKIDAAFDDFKKAYLELIALARPYGVSMEGEPPKLSADGTSLQVPPPLALKPVKR